LEKTDVLTQKANITLPNAPGNQTKAQIEALLKKGPKTPSSTPYRLATNTTGQQPSMEMLGPRNVPFSSHLFPIQPYHI